MNTAEKESDDDRRISIICFSLTGKETAQKLKEGLEKCGYHTELYKKSDTWKILSLRVQQTGQQSTSTGRMDLFLSEPVGLLCAASHRRLPVRSQTRQFWSWMSADSL